MTKEFKERAEQMRAWLHWKKLELLIPDDFYKNNPEAMDSAHLWLSDINALMERVAELEKEISEGVRVYEIKSNWEHVWKRDCCVDRAGADQITAEAILIRIRSLG